jgi:MFS family permease
VTAIAQSTTDSPQSQIPIDSRRNVFAFTSDIATFIVGTYFIPATTVLVGLASQLTDDKTLIGVVGMTWSVTWFLPQLIAARIVRGKRRQKPYLMIPSAIGRNAFLLIALWLIVTQAQAPILTVWVLIGCIAIFNVCDALAGVAWFDMMSRTLSPRMRSRSVSVGQFIGGIFGIGAGLIVGRVLAPDGLPFPQNYAFIFGCTWVCMAISLILISFLREMPMAEAEQKHAQDTNFVASLKDAVRSDGIFRRVLTVRVLTGIELMAASFYLVFAKEQLGMSDSVTGIFNIALIIGGIAGIALFGWLADRFTSLSVVRAAAIMQFIAPLIALIFALASAFSNVPTNAAVVGFIVVFLLRGAIEHSLVLGTLGYLMDSAPERHRAMYVGAINTLSGVVALSPVIGGIWIDALTAQGTPLLAYILMFAGVIASVGAGIWLSFRLPRLQIH